MARLSALRWTRDAIFKPGMDIKPPISGGLRQISLKRTTQVQPWIFHNDDCHTFFLEKKWFHMPDMFNQVGKMETRIEAHIINWQNRFNGGSRHVCARCKGTIYLDQQGSYRGICPKCGKTINAFNEHIEESLKMSNGGASGVGRKKINRKHLIVFILWWLASAIVGAYMSGYIGILLSILFNVLLTLISFRAFTYEITKEAF